MSHLSTQTGNIQADEIVCGEQGPAVWGWQMATFNKLAVVVAQQGADISSFAARLGDTQVEVVQQRAQETPGQLTQRVRERVLELAASGRKVLHAGFVARSGFGVGDVMAAAGPVRSLVAVMVAVGVGEVYLKAAPKDLQASYALTALADAIREQLQGTGVTLTTDFEKADPEAPGRTSAHAAALGALRPS